MLRISEAKIIFNVSFLLKIGLFNIIKTIFASVDIRSSFNKIRNEKMILWIMKSKDYFIVS